ncbi:MAG: hypothetical protein A2X40_00425 [Elusimicrobia bacterium GWC2_65_9]|nr:MAG: hypothetical protein A2X40_00425 [Elusimicrobia bacterium GWC2_65_9]
MKCFAAGLALAWWLCAPGRLWASSGGSFDIPRSLPLGPGALASDAGNVWLLAAAAQSAGGLASSTQTFSNLSGYLIFRSSYAAVILAQAARQLKSRDGWSLGVSTASEIGLSFATPMATGTLANATTVYWVGDRLGNVFSSTVAFSLGYDPGLQAASIAPAAGWGWGNTYQIVVGTGALDADFNALPSSYTANLLTLMDFSQRNVVKAVGNAAMRVDVASSALPGTGLILFVSDPAAAPDRINPAQIQTANAKALSNLGPRAQAVSIAELNAYDEQGALLNADFSVPVMLSLPYATSNGYVSGTAQARPKNLAAWVLNEPASLWVKLPVSSVGSAQVTAPLKHFSVYGLMALQDQDVSQVYPFPVPWRPFADNPSRYGTLSGGITFANVPQTGTIKIYTVGGELVRELHLDGSPTMVWDGKNALGAYVAGEVYLWVTQSGSNRKAGKLMIVR